MEQETRSRRLSFGATPIIFLLALPFFYVAADFLWGNKIPFDRWAQYFSSSNTSSFCIGNKATINKTLEELEFMKFHISRLVRGDDRTALDAKGFACDKTVHSIVCVSNKHATIDKTDDNMTVYIPSSESNHGEMVIQPYAKQENELPQISPVRILRYTNTTTTPPPCRHRHTVPAVIFSSGSTGNVFHEMNEIIIPLFITTRHFRSRVVFVLNDYKPSFVSKYGKILSGLSDHDVINPSANRTVHCFPSTVVGLRYHDNLALLPTQIPGGYSMPDFRNFLRQVYGLRFAHVSQTPKGKKPRLMLLSRPNTRRFLNEDEMLEAMEGLGFEVVVVRRSRVISDLGLFSRMINSCSVLVGAHGAGLTNEIFLAEGAVMVQVELLGTGWASDTYYGDTARAMGVRYLRYKIEAEESSLWKMYGRNHSVVTDPGSVYRVGGYRAARAVYLDQQNVRVNVERFRETLVEALSLVTEWDG